MGSTAPLPGASPAAALGQDGFCPCAAHSGDTLSLSPAPCTQPSLMFSPARCWSSMSWCNKAAFMQELLYLPRGQEHQLGAVSQHRAQFLAHSRHCRVWGDPNAIPVLSQCYPNAIPMLS